MSNNPSSTLTKPIVDFCLARHERKCGTETLVLICTRVDNHEGHCCDEVLREAWTDRGAVFVCKGDGYDHSAEKGLA
jgi:hypothetical protein